MKKIEAVIFDWAGTTIDYGCFAPVQAFIESFELFGITPTVDEVREPMGMLKREHILTMMKMDRITDVWLEKHGRMWTEKDVNSIYEKSENAIFKILSNFATPKPYVIETVEKLKSNGIKIGSTTGYTSEMMSYVIPAAEKNGYMPDKWFTPNDVNDMGRPYPYMIYRNMESLNVSGVDAVIKVGDTVADIKEGKNAGVITVGVIEGSSIMGLSEDEYSNLSEEERKEKIENVKKIYHQAGANLVIMNMGELTDIIEKIENEMI